MPGVGHDHSEAAEAWAVALIRATESGVVGGVVLIALDLGLQRGDGGIESRQLTLQTITPEGEHRQLAVLMLPTHRQVVSAGAAKGRKH